MTWYDRLMSIRLLNTDELRKIRSEADYDGGDAIGLIGSLIIMVITGYLLWQAVEPWVSP